MDNPREKGTPKTWSRWLQLQTSIQTRSLGPAEGRQESLKSPQGQEQSLRFTDTSVRIFFKSCSNM